MAEARQKATLIRLIRKNAKILRGEPVSILRMINSLMRAQSAQLPERYLLPLSSGLKKVIEDNKRFDQSALPAKVGALFNQNQNCALDNLSGLKHFGKRVEKEFTAAREDSVLAGDAAALASLYDDLGAFPATDWMALLQDGTCVGETSSEQLGPPVEEWSEKVQFGGMSWRKPKPPLLITLFSARVGDPFASPVPPVWAHLGLALLVWRDEVDKSAVVEIGKRLGQWEKVATGLAIMAHLFPELVDWVRGESSDIPNWERKLAVPLAARKLVLGNRDQ